jgi:Carboxypeptidase regulatory-like domain
MNLTKKQPGDQPLCGRLRGLSLSRVGLARFVLGVLFCGFPSPAFSQNPPDAAPTNTPSAQQELQMLGHVTGTVLDSTGAAVAGARVKLTHEGQSSSQEAVSGNDGQFSFSDVAPGTFQLTITAQGFSAQVSSGILHPGEFCVVPQIQLAIATAVTEVHVGPLTTVELAEEQIRIEEKQRVFGVIPNFYVTYIPDAAPLTPKQKFKLAWKSTVDPVTFGLTGAVAGVQQAQNDFSGYGQGAAGYGRRFGAAYGNEVSSTFIGGAILPSLLKQDPRYFYKGSGSVRSRVLYAMANAVICKGDNGHWQPNYSGVLGDLAAGGISNAYYPAKNRDDAALTFENTLIGIGTTAAVNIIQEFIIPRFTPNLPNHQANQP